MSVMQAKLQFVADCLAGEEPMTVLCERHGISRQTGYKWMRRFAEEGAGGLMERSRAPRLHGRAISAELVVALLEARRRKPYWGPKKLLAMLSRQYPERAWPAPSTVADLLRREGLSAPRRRRRRPLDVEQPFGAVAAANDAWCIDFKGWFRTGDGKRCDPLTVSDAHSRYLLGLKIIEPVGDQVQQATDELFREHGLPLRMRSDNGPPFASSGAGGLTRLSARWVKMGIGLERICPGKPQQNGRHERMHGTLKAQTCTPPAATPADQQRRFEAFQDEYNFERPHEALGHRPPGELYSASPRPFPERLEDPCYGPNEMVRRIRTSGEIRWRGDLIFISQALIGEAVGISERHDGHWLVRFADVPLLLIDRYTEKLTRFAPARPPQNRPGTPKTVSDPSRL
jgi:transposase InsO family protein